jgi:hypothetical protein
MFRVPSSTLFGVLSSKLFGVPGSTFAAILVLPLALSACVINVDADGTVIRDEKLFTVPPGAELTLTTFDGSIQVDAWDRPEIRVEIQKRGPDPDVAAALEVKATQEGNRLVVEAPAPRVSHEFVGIGNVSSPSVSFVVSVPKKVKVSANTRDGSIKAANLTGDLTVRTDDGSVQVGGVNGRVSLESGDGSIHAEGRFEALHVQTGDGSIVIEAGEGSTMNGDWDVSTRDGSIVFRIPENFSAQIDATSRDGSVRGDLGGLAHEEGSHGQESLRGRVGNGGHTVKLRSGDGSIRVVNR